MSDVNFVSDGTLDRILDAAAHRRDHMESVLRECFKRKINMLENDLEQATDYCRDMKRQGFDVSEELDEMETFANGLTLAVMLLKREASK